MLKCSTHKKVYPSAEIAEDVLIETWIKFEKGPVAVYKCDDCGYYHLTSQGIMNERLSKHLADGKIKRQKEADDWLRKLKKR